MRRRPRWGLTGTLVTLVVVPLVLATVVTATTAIRTSKQSTAELEAHADPSYRDKLMAIVRGAAKNTASGDAQLAMTLIGLSLAGALWASRKLRRRIAQLSVAAVRMSKGQLDEPIERDGADEIGVLAHALDRMRRDLKQATQLAARKAALERDLAITADLQARFMPKRAAMELHGVRLAGHYEPANQCGGDWWWCEPGEDGSTLLLVGDVTGHGAGPALVTASMATALDCARGDDLASDIPALLKLMSDTLHATVHDDYRMTMSVVRVDPAQGTLQWWSAGAPPVMLLRADGELETLGAAGSLMGDTSFQLGTVERAFQPGDRLLVFTDGIHEMPLPSGGEFGFRRLRKLFKERAALPPEAAVQALANDLRAARGDVEQEDDITFVVLERAA